jgi:alkylation response protein AidB-like acyl-CoA dehydrogenase
VATLSEFRGIEGGDFFEDDKGFARLLCRLVATEDREAIFSSLHDCARLAAGRWNDLARDAARHEHLPRILKRDRVGNIVEKVELSPMTRQLRREVAEFGVVSKTQSHLHKFAITYYLAHNGEASLNCGLSCTDGLIQALEASGPPALRDAYLPLLMSAETPLAGAQFITERAGGSDIGAIEATARQNRDGTWSITGEKWFCSNPDEYFLVAARPEGSHSGTSGIAVFLVPRVLPDGTLNRLSFLKLKDKLGTQSLPTAEIDFDRATGFAIGDPREGFKTLMNYVINVSRIHNAVNACGMLHRAFLEARNYARQREAFGKPIIEYPLVQEGLVGLLERLWRYRSFTFKLISIVDKHGLAPTDRDQAMWQRFLVNLAKYRTAVTLTDSIREAILIFGANGIVEDFTVLPRLLRDAMIVETWEGTHNTLCLQIMRDAARSDLLARWHAEVAASLERWPAAFLGRARTRFSKAFNRTVDLLTADSIQERPWAERHARRIVDRLASFLEIGWMSELAVSIANDDSAAVLTSLAAQTQLGAGEDFDSPALLAIAESGNHLIDEIPFRTDIGSL